MNKKYRKLRSLLLIMFLFLAGYNFWTLRDVKILYTNFFWGKTTVVVVDHFPMTDRNKVQWYLEHEEELKTRYETIKPFTTKVIIIDANGGLVSAEENPHEDLRCFDDIPSDKKCVIKNTVLIVDILAQSLVYFQMGYGGLLYSLDENGNIQPEIQEWPNMSD